MSDDAQIKETQPDLPLSEIAGIAKAVRQLLDKSPEQVEALRRQLRREGLVGLTSCARPKGTYYNHYYAQLIRPHLDSMMANGKIEKKFLLKSFERLSLNSLYQLVTQACMYLRENPDATVEERVLYKDFYEKTFIKKDKTKDAEAVWIRWIEKKHALTQVDAHDVSRQDLSYKERLNEWLDDPRPKDNPLELVGLDLKQEEIDSLEQQLDQLPNIASAIRSNKIKIIRTDLPVTNKTKHPL